MTTSEWIRVGVIIVAILILLARRYDLMGTLRERKKKKERQEAHQRRRVERKEQRQQAQERQQDARAQTAEILKRGLGRLQQKSLQAAAGLEIWYLEGGAQPDARPVLLLHGFGGDKENWGQVGQLLVGEGCHLVAPDLPGFGQNAKDPKKPYDVTTQTKRVRAFIHKAGLKSFHLVGHSVGGSIAAAIAYSAPKEVASLTLIEPFGVRVPYESELDKMLEQERNPMVIATPMGYDNLLGFVFHHPPEMTPALKKVRAEQAAKNRIFNLKVWKEIWEGERANLLDLLLPVIKTKTLIIQGAQSKVVHPATPEVVTGMMTDVRSAVIENCGHFPMLEQPEETAEHLMNFFKTVPPQPNA